MLFNVLFPKPLGRHQHADQKNFIFMTDGKVYANKTINKGALKIFPFGNVQRVKEVKEDEKKTASTQGECETLGWRGCLSNHAAQGECGETKWCHPSLLLGGGHKR